jgi:hypothetical protein
MNDTHLTAPTRFVQVDGDNFAYRRWGNASAGQPPCSSCSTSGAAWITEIR